MCRSCEEENINGEAVSNLKSSSALKASFKKRKKKKKWTSAWKTLKISAKCILWQWNSAKKTRKRKASISTKKKTIEAWRRRQRKLGGGMKKRRKHLKADEEKLKKCWENQWRNQRKLSKSEEKCQYYINDNLSWKYAAGSWKYKENMKKTQKRKLERKRRKPDRPLWKRTNDSCMKGLRLIQLQPRKKLEAIEAMSKLKLAGLFEAEEAASDAEKWRKPIFLFSSLKPFSRRKKWREALWG